MFSSLIAAVLLPAVANAAGRSTIDQIAGKYGLSTNYNFTQPSDALNSAAAQKFLVSNWNLNGDHIDFGLSDM